MFFFLFSILINLPQYIFFFKKSELINVFWCKNPQKYFLFQNRILNPFWWNQIYKKYPQQYFKTRFSSHFGGIKYIKNQHFKTGSLTHFGESNKLKIFQQNFKTGFLTHFGEIKHNKKISSKIFQNRILNPLIFVLLFLIPYCVSYADGCNNIQLRL